MTSEQAGEGRIVVGYDGSPSSADALDWAARQAQLTGNRLEVVMTWQWPPSLGWSVPIPDDFDPEGDVERSVEKALDEVRQRYPDVPIDTRVANGHPAPVLVDASKGATLLVVGSRGHGEFAGMLLGSVSEYCATKAHCPVLVHRAA
jgi:nucleotide-binding universal stress UspA family protein